ncbi:TPA: phenylalanine--tRNA ligase subunit beta, partial [Candidatus Micrarchaeota archaeon]|nr:phenylalanine--tRNA ligase subunit beta [Candidatus Micrarchaeota archaeon]
MPVITLTINRMRELLSDEKLTVEKLVDTLPWIGVDIEDVGRDYVKIEYNPNRPDFGSPVGVARAIAGLLGKEVGLPKYEASPPTQFVRVSEAVSRVRPYIVAAIVRGVRLSEEALAELIDLQEDLHEGIGRKRRKVSIGLHDLDKVEGPFSYDAVAPDEVKFVPLGWSVEATPSEILVRHEKGLEYGHLLEDVGLVPLVRDGRGRVMAMPPVINARLTEVTPATRNLFMDVTGTDLDLIARVLDILVTTLADMGGRIERVEVRYPDVTLETPLLRHEVA